MIQAGKSVRCPWNKHCSRTVTPSRIIGFDTFPGPGSEPANLGLCLYPAEIDWEYTPQEDQRFQTTAKDGWQRFSLTKWDKWNRNNRVSFFYTEKRKVPTKLDGWHWGSFCKTQYASDPQCGGVPNFLRCHISVITLLDRIAKLPGLKVRVDDEGKYGPCVYAEDWQAKKPHYRRHKGRYNPATLAKEVGDWNTFIAGLAGALSDAMPGWESPIKDFPDFEQLEFHGRNQKHLAPFLEAMKKLAKATAAEPTNDQVWQGR